MFRQGVLAVGPDTGKERTPCALNKEKNEIAPLQSMIMAENSAVEKTE